MRFAQLVHNKKGGNKAMAIRNAEGQYYGTFKECGLDENVNGKVFLFLLMDIQYISVDGEWVDLPKPLQRQIIIYATDATLSNDFFKRQMDFLGFNGDFANPDFSFPNSPGDGKEAELFCEHKKQDNGNIREEWRFHIPYEQRERKQVKKDKIRELNAKYKQLGAQTPKPTPKPKVESVNEEDIPF